MRLLERIERLEHDLQRLDAEVGKLKGKAKTADAGKTDEAEAPKATRTRKTTKQG